MNTKRFVLAGLAVFVFIFFYEWVLHGMILKNLYIASPNLWRTEAEMERYFLWLVLGQFLVAIIFAYIFLKGYENRGVAEGARYGFLIGLLFGAPTLIMYAVQPLQPILVVAWIVGGIVEYVLAGVILAAIYRRPASLRA